MYRRADGRWCGRLYLPDGRRRWFYGKKQADVLKALADAKRLIADGSALPRREETVELFVEAWLKRIKATVQLGTWEPYARYWRLHALPSIGPTPLCRLDHNQLQALYDDKLKILSPNSVRALHGAIRTALNDAVRWGLIPKNPAMLADPPRHKRFQITTLTTEQAQRFVETARADRLFALYLTAISTGMREGELLALKWSEVHLDSGMISVRATLGRRADGLHFREPKTEKSRRRVYLIPDAIEALRAHKDRQGIEREFMGHRWREMDLVFPNTVGKPMEASNLLGRSFYPLLQRAELPRVRFHDLRHSAATLLLVLGIHPKVVSEMLGHSTVAITLDLYSHVIPAMHQDMLPKMAALLTGTRENDGDHGTTDSD